VITEAIIWVFSRLAALLISLLPSWTPPAWLVTVTSTLADAVGKIAMLNGWVPVAAIGVAVAFITACSGIALLLRFGRMGLSLSTGGGGSAA
jgi:hypothetical protein